MTLPSSPESQLFDLKPLRARCDATSWSRGQSLFLHRQVRDFAIRAEPGGWQISGMVQGTMLQPYSTQVSVRRGSLGQAVSWSGSCS